MDAPTPEIMALLEPCMELGDLPDYVKTAAVESFDAAGLDAYVFADARRREFPTHTKAACFAAAAAFYRSGRARYRDKEAAVIETRLLKAADYWQIAHDVARLRAKASATAPPLADDKFAYVRVYDDGRKERRMPLRTPAETRQAVDYFRKYAYELGGYEARVKIAARILAAAEDYGAALPPAAIAQLEAAAGLGECSYKQAAALVESRIVYVAPPAAAELTKLAAAVRRRPEGEFSKNACLRELATTLDHVDRAAGLTSKYGKSLAPPEALFGVTYTKQAGADDAVTLPTGGVYRRDDLAKLSASELTAAFGPFALDDVMGPAGVDAGKMAAFVETLPLPDAEMLEGLLRKAGAVPLGAKLAAHQPAYDFQKAAAAYGR